MKWDEVGQKDTILSCPLKWTRLTKTSYFLIFYLHFSYTTFIIKYKNIRVVMLTLNINDTVEQEFNALIKKQGKSSERVISDLILEYLEDYKDTLKAEDTIKKINEGTEQVLNLDEAEKLLYELAN